MKQIPKPEWLLFAESCRTAMEKDRPTKDGRRREYSMYRNCLRAQQEMGYEGDLQDWRYLMGFRAR